MSKVLRWAVLAAVASVLALWLAPTLVSAAGPATGYLEVCKASDGSGVTGTFRFTVGIQTIDVPVGACSAPLQVPAGAVTVTEEAVTGVGVTAITVSPAGRAVSTSTATRSAEVTVVAGDVATQTLVTFTNRSEVGLLTLCKAAGSGVAAGTNFTFVVAGRGIAVPAGQCTNAGQFPYGTNVTVSEVQAPGTRVSDIAVIPPSRVVDVPSLTDGVVTVAIGPGVTQVTFTNTAVLTGSLQICKRAASTDVTGSFTFVVAGQRVDVPVGSCSGVLQVPEGVVEIREVARGDTMVSDIAASPASRLVTTDLADRSATVRIVAGNLTQMATVTFTNELQTSQVKVCKVAGTGVTLGAPFTFTVAGRTLSVPAGSCVLAGTFPLNSLVPIAETVPSGMQVAAIKVDPIERMNGPANVALGMVSVLAGPGVTEVTVTNQTTQAVTTTSTLPLLNSTTTVAPPLSTTTIPQVTTTTLPPGSSSTTLPLVASTTTTTVPPLSTTTSVPPSTTTTVPPLSTTTSVPPSPTTTIRPLAATTTTLPPATTPTTSDIISIISTTTVPLLATSTTLPVATTSTTAPGAPTTSTTTPSVTTSTTVIPLSGTSTTVASVTAPPSTTTTSTTVPPCVTATTLSTTVPTTAPLSTSVTTTDVPVPTTTSTSASMSNGMTPSGPESSSPCIETSTLSTPSGIQRVTTPPATARLALTGAKVSLLIGLAFAALVAGMIVLVASAAQPVPSAVTRAGTGPRRRRSSAHRRTCTTPAGYGPREAAGSLRRRQRVWRL